MVKNLYNVKKHGEHGGHDVSVITLMLSVALRWDAKVNFIQLPGQLPRSRGCVHLGGSETRKIRY